MLFLAICPQYDSVHFAVGDEAKAASQARQSLYKRDRLTNMKFREVDLVKLVLSCVEAPSNMQPPGAGLPLESLLHKKYIKV